MLVNLNELVLNTSSNNEGAKLYDVLEQALNSTNEFILCVDNEATLSSSFLNSSLGSFVEKHGITKFKSLIKIKASKTQFERIALYLEKHSQLV